MTAPSSYCQELRIVTAPSPPVTLSQLKAHARIEVDAEDDLLQIYLDAAAAAVSRHANRSLRTTRYKLTLGAFSPTRHRYQRLPMGPVSSIVSIEYVTLGATLEDLASEYYQTRMDQDAVRILGLPGDADTDRPDTLVITYDAGHSSDAAVPPEYRTAVLSTATHFYEWRITGPLPAPIAKNIPRYVEFR